MNNKTPIAVFISPTIILIVSFIVSAYWVTGNIITVYANKFVGAIFEILWLPMLLLLFILPVVSLFFWIRGHCKLNSLYLYAFAIIAAAFILIITRNN